MLIFKNTVWLIPEIMDLICIHLGLTESVSQVFLDDEMTLIMKLKDTACLQSEKYD